MSFSVNFSFMYPAQLCLHRRGPGEELWGHFIQLSAVYNSSSGSYQGVCLRITWGAPLGLSLEQQELGTVLGL